jgi:hypothetical protein
MCFFFTEKYVCEFDKNGKGVILEDFFSVNCPFFI